MCVCARARAHACMSAGAFRGQRHQIALELQVIVTASCGSWESNFGLMEEHLPYTEAEGKGGRFLFLKTGA